ncbi:MAG: isoleucine--tRNA ligase [Phycisphaerales bacterium]|jgi:isoleucyl-tRNA synthetase|nr:isoleucine--tRNA ligase [Phycisphaerales bacterium]
MSDNKKVYKKTVNLPKTSFKMRAGLLQKEPAFQAQWEKEGLYQQIRDARKGAPRFILHDGPPYANGNIHMGTALNKVLKDMVIRVKTMSGMDAPYIPGWDCHGLPIEAKVMEQLGDKAKGMDAKVIRRICAEYAAKFVKLQKTQFKRLGVMGLFEEPYLTMNPGYESAALEVFARLVEEGLVFRQLKPVHWSIANQTALADAELEHHDKQDSSIFVALELTSGVAAVPHTEGEKVALIIWTTTPWTLPANRAVAISPRFEYACVKVETQDGPATWVVADERLDALLETITKTRPEWLKSHEVIERVKGQDLLDAAEPITYAHPLSEGMTCPLVGADYVTLEDGSGLVHTAPGHGIDDYHTGLNNKLEIYCPVQGDGTFDETAPEWLQGVVVWDANQMIIDHLLTETKLVAAHTITHSYPHDWRSKTPTIFRATEQWFIGVDRPVNSTTRTLREMAVGACSTEAEEGGVDFIPSWGQNRIGGMLDSRPDWCISRQRSWGLPIPVFFNADEQPLVTPASVRAVAKTFAEQGSDSWFTLTPAELLGDYDPTEDEALENPEKFAVADLVAGSDIFDVWFESGSSWHAVAKARKLVEDIPVDMYLEGSDQHRGWFQLSLLPALGAQQRPPYRTVLTHGFVVDDAGLKMSKSIGNVIDVMQQLEKRGADILRLWIASQNYQDDVRCSEDLIAQSEDAYRKIRNTLKFALGACGDFDPAVNSIEPAEHSVDLWMKLQIDVLIRDVREHLERYEFHRATRLIYEFCTVQASNIYLSAVKDRLYCDGADSPRRRASQTTIYRMLMTLVKLLAPILPHTCQEVWDHIPSRSEDEPKSVHLALLPECDTEALDIAEAIVPVTPDEAAGWSWQLQPGPAWIWEKLMELRRAGLLKLEALRHEGVTNPLDVEAVFKIAADNDQALSLIDAHLSELEDLLGVGYARIETVDQLPEGEVVQVEMLDSTQKYATCNRSWKRRPDVGADSDYPDLSARDAAVMKTLPQSE